MIIDINEKAGTTFIATISMDPIEIIPLACIAKSKSERYEKKIGFEGNDACFHSNNG